MEINLKKPIDLCMKFVEAEDRLPSFSMSIEARIIDLGATYIYDARGIWFECLTWDRFGCQLDKLCNENIGFAQLVSIGEKFHFKIENTRDVLSLDLICKESENEDCKSELRYHKNLGLDGFAVIKRQFEEFAKWR